MRGRSIAHLKLIAKANNEVNNAITFLLYKAPN